MIEPVKERAKEGGGKLAPPNGFAIVGASERGVSTAAVLKNAAAYRYPGPFWLVNPNSAQILGLRCYPSVSDLPGKPEVAMLMVSADRCRAVVAECVAAGIPQVVVVSDGFAERGRPDLQDELLALVEGSPTLLYGPNSIGFIDLAASLCAVGEPIPTNARPGPVSFISQSGALLSSFMAACSEDNLGLDWCVSLGNSAHVDLARAVMIAADRPGTKVICLYSESLGRHPTELAAALEHARSARKPVVILKIGRSERAVRIALSHTASITGPDRLVDAFLEAHGAIRADNVEQLVRIAAVCALTQSLPATGGVAVLGTSGGTAAMASDAAAALGIRLAVLGTETMDRLREVAPPGAYVDNPFDVVALPGQGFSAANIWQMVYEDARVGFVLAPCSITFPDSSPEREYHRQGFGVFKQLAHETGKPTLIASLGLQPWTDWTDATRAAAPPGFSIVRGIGLTMEALAKVFPAHTVLLADAPECKTVDSERGHLLGEEEGRRRLHAIDLPLVRGRTFGLGESLELGGLEPPFVVKVVAVGLGHKASIGGVRVGCADANQARSAADEVLNSVQLAGVPQSSIHGVRIEEMASGIELLVGVQRYAELGSFLTVGVGGALAEVSAVHATCALPAARAEISAMLRRLGLERILGAAEPGFVVLVERLGVEFERGRLADLGTVELNPVIITAAGPRIADVLMVAGD